MLAGIPRTPPAPHLLVRPLLEVERRTIESASILCVGNLSLAAGRLGVSRTFLHNKLNQYRLEDGEAPLPDRRVKYMAASAGVL